MTKVRKSKFARMEGISPARVSQYIASGILRKCLLPSGLLDLEIAQKELRGNLDHGKRMDYDLRFDRIGKKKERRSSRNKY